MDRLIWFKGELIKAEDAKVHALSPTAQFGLNVFEGLRGYWSKPDQELYIFRFDDHITRLFQSCKLIGIKCPYSKEDILRATREVLAANDFRADVAVRTTLFVDEEGSWNSSEPVDMFVAPIVKSRLDSSSLIGKKVSVSSWERIDDRSLPPRVKAGANYINGRYAFMEAKAAGYDLPILLDRDGKVSESAGSCIMMVRDGILATPRNTSSILESITKDTILQLAKERKLEVQERDIDRTELYLADELFLCGSAVEITPVTLVDQHIVAQGNIGELTQQLLQDYHRVVEEADGKNQNWLTPVFQGEY